MLRYYEEQGLLSSERLANGYRDYPEGAVDQHPQIIPVDVQRAANVVLVAFLEEEPPQQLLLLFGQGSQRFPDACAFFAGQNRNAFGDASYSNYRRFQTSARIVPQ